MKRIIISEDQIKSIDPCSNKVQKLLEAVGTDCDLDWYISKWISPGKYHPIHYESWAAYLAAEDLWAKALEIFEEGKEDEDKEMNRSIDWADFGLEDEC